MSTKLDTLSEWQNVAKLRIIIILANQWSSRLTSDCLKQTTFVCEKAVWTVKWGSRFCNARIIEDFTAWANVNLFMPECSDPGPLSTVNFQIYYSQIDLNHYWVFYMYIQVRHIYQCNNRNFVNSLQLVDSFKDRSYLLSRQITGNKLHCLKLL